MGLFSAIKKAVTAPFNAVGKAVGEALDEMGLKDELLFAAQLFESIPILKDMAPLEYLDEFFEGEMTFAQALQVGAWLANGPIGGAMPGLGNMGTVNSLAGLGQLNNIGDLASTEGLAAIGNLAGVDVGLGGLGGAGGPLGDLGTIASFAGVDVDIGIDFAFGSFDTSAMELLNGNLFDRFDLSNPMVQDMFKQAIRNQLRYARV